MFRLRLSGVCVCLTAVSAVGAIAVNGQDDFQPGPAASPSFNDSALNEPRAESDVFDDVDPTADRETRGELTSAADTSDDQALPPVHTRESHIQFRVETADESAVRASLNRLYEHYTRLYAGDELIELHRSVEKAVKQREAELASRSETLAEKMGAIRSQLEALKDDASAVGVRVQLEAMIKAAEGISEAPGKPSLGAPEQSNDFVPSPGATFDFRPTQPTPAFNRKEPLLRF